MSFMKRFEVTSETELTRWINDDIKPIEASCRTWAFWTFHNYCMSSVKALKVPKLKFPGILVNSNISTYLTRSSLIALGLTWWQAIVSIVVGNILATIFVILNSIPGAYYHIGSPVVNRYVWGMYFWYGFQAWIGGECLYVCLMALDPSLETHIPNHMPESTGMTTAQFVAYIIFSVASLPNFFYFSSATSLIFEVVLLIWALATMGPEGFGDTISSTPTAEASSTGWLTAYGIISTIGSIAAGILNQNDYALFSFPLYAIICSVIGILVTAATQNRFGGALWNLPDIFTTLIENGGSRERAAGFFAGAALVISQIGVNVPGNALSGGFDLAATLPRYIIIRRGAYITAVVSVACNPWRLVNKATTFISVLGSYSVFLGPMTGMMISSYFVINKRKINVDDLFVGNKASVYWYTWGIKWRAIIAWVCGVAPSMPGFVDSVQLLVKIPIGLTHLYYICFLTGFAISANVHCALHIIFPAEGLNHFVASSPPGRALMAEYQDRWDGETSEAVSDFDKDARVVDREVNF
ncbi:NCS1 nucleoside transporter family protein [Acephala macrosclerotiorum]|nr:NCS1 nucleoside transporter family protein [Acephala macrosclerotiorum]